MPFDVSILVFAVAVFVMWSSFKQGYADQSDELDAAKKENKFLRDEIDRLVDGYKTDNVTKIPNEMRLDSQVADFLSEHPSRGFSLIYIDIDDFKKINNALGSSRANIVLRGFAWKIRSGMRRDEQIYRSEHSDIYRRFVGGDEFVILIYGSEQDCIFFMKRLFNDLMPELSAELREQLALDEEFSLTISAGSCTYDATAKRQILRENSHQPQRALQKIISDAEKYCQDAKTNKYNVSFVWNGLVASGENEPAQYSTYRKFFQR
ncbi:MAG: GGDEF domain-containing protein [Pseudomonadota bacterium]